MDREQMTFDLLIVGAGPAGLSAAIRAKQLNTDMSICILEKGAEVGAHILSGAVFNPRALEELLPDWQSHDAPISVQATKDSFYFLTGDKHYRLPTPPQMDNAGNYIVSLGQVCRYLATQAESLGIEIYPGFAAAQLCFNDNNEVIGVLTNDVGRDKAGNEKPGFQPGMQLLAKHTFISEGCRGSLAQQLIHHYQLDAKSSPQTYGLGLKEIWEVSPDKHEEGHVIHTVGWPLPNDIYGGSFIYHWHDNKVLVGFVAGLDYANPSFSPYQTFQQFKHHPYVSELLKDGRCLSYGARAINEGGYQSIPTMAFPGGLLLGCSAGLVNVPAIKGSHYAMKSGIIAAEVHHASSQDILLSDYEPTIKKSWIGTELYQARNIRPSFRKGLIPGLAYAGLDTYVLRGRAPWTFKQHADHDSLDTQANTISYPKPDGTLSFDRLTSVNRANVYHDESQPCHLTLQNPDVPVAHNYKLFGGPESLYCPAGVYEYVEKSGEIELQINAQNCIHCKTCDIKDPKQNIKWVPPESGGPNYGEM